MLIGRGLLARAFAAHYEHDENAVVFASGVSHSQCEDEAEYIRETALLRSSLERHADARLFMYFSTCSIFDPSARHSRYVAHKLQMEDIVSAHRAHLVLRLPIVVGSGGNPHSLLSHLAQRIEAGQPVEVWENAGRYLIDIDDAAAIARDLADTEHARNERINVAAPHDVAVIDLVNVLGRVLAKQPVCRLVEKGSRYGVDTERIRLSVARLGIGFDRCYVERVLRKYYGSANVR